MACTTEIHHRSFSYSSEMWAGEKKIKSKCLLVYPRVFSLQIKIKRPFKYNKTILQHIKEASEFGTKCKDACLKVLLLLYV